MENQYYDNNIYSRLLLAETVAKSMTHDELFNFVKTTMYSHFGKITDEEFKQCWNDYGMDDTLSRAESEEVSIKNEDHFDKNFPCT